MTTDMQGVRTQSDCQQATTSPLFLTATLQQHSSIQPIMSEPNAIMSKKKPAKGTPYESVRTISSRQPNSMGYQTPSGAWRDIYLPRGTMHAAWDALLNERWDELEKYELFCRCNCFVFQLCVLTCSDSWSRRLINLKDTPILSCNTARQQGTKIPNELQFCLVPPTLQVYSTSYTLYTLKNSAA